MNVFHNAADLVGNTPLLELVHLQKELGCKARLFAKVEGFNPSGSVKDRIAKQMIISAEEEGLLKEGSTIIEPTSGNTGIGIAAISAARGYRCIIVMPETMSVERRRMIAAYGAEIVLTPGKLGMAGSVEEAKRLEKEIPGSLVLGQFDNPNNPKAHVLTTGPEIEDALDGKVDAFVGGIGTGGTVTGVATYLKSKNPSVKVYGVEPASSPLLTEGHAGPHKIQGIGANFVPSVLDRNLIDEVVDVADEDAFAYARMVAKKEGLLVGISSGAALKAAAEIAKRDEFDGKNVVVLFPDGGDRYFSTPLFEEEAK